ncbi:MAG: TlpA family protein disulfide reductase [Flavobacteriaceae bacterium]|nr:TlpA family protein disulfide reductase [Flavobacteriaceae bacterium]MDH3796855.1 TlpA family protein disulfide reductase [Flavobacteriaceae bacterium]
MKIKKRTLLNIILFAFILSFFLTPLGYHSKVLLNQLFAGSPTVIPVENREQIADYQWTLKDPQWEFFNFERSKGKVVFINFWASWRLPCAAELAGIQDLYDSYGDRVDFYIVTDEERPPVRAFMAEKKFDFPVTYMIIGEKAPFEVLMPPASYLIDKNGYIVIQEEGIANWDSSGIHALLDQLLEEK